MRIHFAFIFFLIALPIYAKSSTWTVDDSNSKLIFSGTQNNAPIQGAFKKFKGQLNWDAEAIQNSSVELVVEAGSVWATYVELVEALKMSDWLHVSEFPKATFKSDKIQKNQNGSYTAKGTLTIRSKMHDQSVQFSLVPVNSNEMQAEGEFTFNRLDFDLGQGEWSSLSEIKNPIQVQFSLLFKQ